MASPRLPITGATGNRPRPRSASSPPPQSSSQKKTDRVIFKFGDTSANNFLQSHLSLLARDWYEDSHIDLHTDYLSKHAINSLPEKSIYIARCSAVVLAKDGSPDNVAHAFPDDLEHYQHIFFPINSQLAEKDKEYSAKGPAGMHWSLMHIINTSTPPKVRTYDPNESMNERACGHLGMNLLQSGMFNLDGQITHVDPNHIPQALEGRHCGAVVTWILRQLVWRIIEGRDLVNDASAYRFLDGGFSARDERTFLKRLATALEEGWVRY